MNDDASRGSYHERALLDRYLYHSPNRCEHFRPSEMRDGLCQDCSIPLLPELGELAMGLRDIGPMLPAVVTGGTRASKHLPRIEAPE